MRSSFQLRRVLAVPSLALVGVLALSGSTMAAPGTTIYDNIPHPTPGNVVSEAFEAQSASEFGDQIQFAAGPRVARNVTVLMSSWGCQSGSWTSTCTTTPGSTFNHAITINFYSVGSGGAVGSLLGTKTQTFAIPFRPSTSASCGDGRWSNGTNCFNGYATPITFDVSSLALTLPNKVIVSVAYNTTHYGASPIGESASCYTSPGGCGYDSLNVGVADPATSNSVGNNPAPDDAYLSSTWSGAYCDGGSGGLGSFRLDHGAPGCWTPYKPAIAVTASYPTAATKDDCKGNGWQTLSRADGSPFKNQRDCIQYVNTGK